MITQLPELTPQELDGYGYSRAKDIAFDAVMTLWRRRQLEGMKQTDLAAALGWDPALVCRKLQGPGNWTLRTLGAFAEGLRGELQIKVVAQEEPLPIRANYHAYAEYELPCGIDGSATRPPTVVTPNSQTRALFSNTAS